MTSSNPLEGLQIIPTGGPLGVEIKGINLTHPLQEGVVKCVRQALLDYCVVVFRNQKITEEDQVRFTSYFGKPVPHVRKQKARLVQEIFIVSNVEKDGKPIGALGNDEISFHSDLSYMAKPGTISILYAVEVPKIGGATQWCNCYAAYETLDSDLKSQLNGLRAIHRHYVESQNPPKLVTHPVVRTHPETGRKCLYVGPHLTQSILNFKKEKSRDLLNYLFQHLEQLRFIWTHNWQVEDLVMWDNRSTLHRREWFPATERRIMKRTQVFNDEIPYE